MRAFQFPEPGQESVEPAGFEVARQREALDLAAGRLGKLADREDRGDGNAGALVDDALHLARLRRERRDVVVLGQQEHEDVVGRRVRGAHARRSRAAQFDARVLREHQFDVLREVVLARDEDDLLDAAGDDEFAVEHRPQVPGVEVAVRGSRLFRQRGVVVIAGAHVVAADQDAPDRPRRGGGAGRVGDAHFAMPYRSADAHQFDGVVGTWLGEAHRVARPEGVARQRNGRQRRADFRKRDGQAGLGQAVHGEHDVGMPAVRVPAPR